MTVRDTNERFPCSKRSRVLNNARSDNEISVEFVVPINPEHNLINQPLPADPGAESGAGGGGELRQNPSFEGTPHLLPLIGTLKINVFAI